MRIRARNFFNHECDLPHEVREFHVQSPYDSWFGRWRSSLRMSLTVDYHIYLNRYYKSTSACRKEKRRHMMNPRYKYIIHPYSSFAEIKSKVVAFLHFVTYMLESFNNGFVLQQLGVGGTYVVVSTHVTFFFEILLLIDVVLRFFEGYVDFRTREIVLERRLIADKYMKTYFFFDAVPVANALLYTMYVDVVLPHLNWTSRQDKIFTFFFNQFHRLRLARTNMILDAVDIFLQKFKVPEGIRTIVFIFLLLLIILHTINSLAYGSRHFQKHMNYNRTLTWKNLYIARHKGQMSYFADGSTQYMFKDHGSFVYGLFLYIFHLGTLVCHFFGLNVYMYRTEDTIEMALYAIITMSGLVFNIYVVACILDIFGVINISEMEYEQYVVQAENYFTRKDVPQDLRERVFEYFECRFKRKFFSEKEILESLSNHLQVEILLYCCANLINEVSLFKGLSREAAGCLMALLKKEIFLKGDLIYHSLERDGTLYFILNGTCELVLLPIEREVMHLQDGEVFGDIRSYIDHDLRSWYGVRAVELVETFKLEVKDIEYCGEMHPEILKRIRTMTKSKARKYNQVFAIVEADEDTTGDIIEELRKRRILHHGLKRIDFH